MKRQLNPQISSSGELALAAYEQTHRKQEDLTSVSLRNYLSNVHHFMAWYEHNIDIEAHVFTSQAIAKPSLTRYGTYLQIVIQQKPASTNRSLISLNCWLSRATQEQIIHGDLSALAKLVGQEDRVPRHLDDKEVQAFVVVVTNEEALRDCVLIILLLYTGLRAREICRLRRDPVKLEKRSSPPEVIGKRNKYGEVLFNATTCTALEKYLLTLPSDIVWLFLSGKTKEPYRNVSLVILSKSMQPERNLSMSDRMICVIVSDIAWQMQFRSSDLLKLWNTAY